jgi:ATP-dependent Clp protease ATP-binding subunit ClpA
MWGTNPKPATGRARSPTVNNFTPRAQQVLALARKEAARLNRDYVGTEHLLLGLIKLGQGTAVNVLHKMGLDLETVRMEVEKQVGSGPQTGIVGNMPYTQGVKKVLALAGKEARQLNHSYVGTEHIFLGLLREGEGMAAHVLRSFDVDIERTRNEILKELDPSFNPSEVGLSAAPPMRAVSHGWITRHTFSRRVQAALNLAAAEATLKSRTHITTADLLLGLLSEGEGAAASILKNLQVDTGQLRRAIESGQFPDE